MSDRYADTLYEKYFVIQDTSVTSYDSVDYEAYSIDLFGSPLRGLPTANSVQKLSYCMTPGEYTIHAVDTANEGWWGGAWYSLSTSANGATLVHEQMNSTSSSIQSTTFTVSLPHSESTSFSENSGTSRLFID